MLLAGPGAATSASVAAFFRADSLPLLASIALPLLLRLPRAFLCGFQVFACTSSLFGRVDGCAGWGVRRSLSCPEFDFGAKFLARAAAITIAIGSVASFAAFCCIYVLK